MRYIENGDIAHFLGAHCLTFFAPFATLRPESAPFDDSAIRKAISDLGYDDTCVDGTAINRHLGGDVPTRTLGYALDALGYDATVRFKCSKDGITHYVRYNSILITASDAVAKIKGR